MPKFEKQYVHFMWSDELEGKTVFFADYISDLKKRVESNDAYYYEKAVQGEGGAPFRMLSNAVRLSCWQFAYYDPYYELKLAHEQGHKIQVLAKGNDKWSDLWLDLSNPDWELEPEMYRVKPDGPAPKPEPELELAETLITNRVLAQWLAEGYGQYMDVEFKVARTYYCYDCYEASADDAQINKDRRVRLWGDTEWHVPTRKYMDMHLGDDVYAIGG